jgi:hypothetical protein
MNRLVGKKPLSSGKHVFIQYNIQALFLNFFRMCKRAASLRAFYLFSNGVMPSHQAKGKKYSILLFIQRLHCISLLVKKRNILWAKEALYLHLFAFLSSLRRTACYPIKQPMKTNDVFTRKKPTLLIRTRTRKFSDI